MAAAALPCIMQSAAWPGACPKQLWCHGLPRWAIESRNPDACGRACRLNNSDAHTFCNNCNVLLTAAMDKAGLSEYCEASEEVHSLTFIDMLLTSVMPLRGCTHSPALRLSWHAGSAGLAHVDLWLLTGYVLPT